MNYSVSEIARRAGVSKSTVSLFLNNKPHVSEPMRKKILTAVEELKQNSNKASFNREKPFRFLLLHPLRMGSIQVFRELLQGIQAGVEALHGRLTLALHQPPFHPDHTTSVLLRDPIFKPDGVLLMGAIRNDPILQEILTEHLPCVLIAREFPPRGFSAVGMDNYLGAKEAVQHLIQIGHRHIVFIGGNEEYEYTQIRRAGYIHAMRSADLKWKGRIFYGNGEEATRAFLKSKNLATAIFFVNDEHALEGIKVLQEQGVRIPEDISVIGFDDTTEMSSPSPFLSSVWVPRFEIGELAVRILAQQIDRPSVGSVRMIIKTQLRIRASSSHPSKP